MTRNSEATRLRLLDAACNRLVEAHGLIEVGDVAKTAAVSVGLVYHHFGSKAGLIAAVVEKFYDDMELAMQSEPALTAAAWLHVERQRLQNAVGFFYRSPLAPYMLTRLSRDAEVASIERQCLSEQIEIGTRNMALGQQLGAVDKQLDAEMTVAFILMGLRHAIARALNRSPRLPEIMLSEQLWALILRIIHPSALQVDSQFAPKAASKKTKDLDRKSKSKSPSKRNPARKD